MAIKIVDEGGVIKAKGNPLGSKIGYFFAVLFFIAGGILIFSNILAIFLLMIAFIIICASAAHMYNARLKKLREAGYTIPENGNRRNKTSGRRVAAVVIFIFLMIILFGGIGWFFFTLDKKPASEKPWTKNLWIYDFRTNIRFKLKTQTLKKEDLIDFVRYYNPKNRFERKEGERFRCFTYEEIAKRDKFNLDISWLKDESLEDSDNLPSPEIIAGEIVENLESALEQFEEIQESLKVK